MLSEMRKLKLGSVANTLYHIHFEKNTHNWQFRMEGGQSNEFLRSWKAILFLPVLASYKKDEEIPIPLRLKIGALGFACICLWIMSQYWDQLYYHKIENGEVIPMTEEEILQGLQHYEQLGYFVFWFEFFFFCENKVLIHS